MKCYTLAREIRYRITIINSSTGNGSGCALQVIHTSLTNKKTLSYNRPVRSTKFRVRLGHVRRTLTLLAPSISYCARHSQCSPILSTQSK